NEPAQPEITPHLYGDGSICDFKGPGFTADGSHTIYLLTASIGDTETSINKAFKNRIGPGSLGLKFRADIFTTAALDGKVPFKFTFQTYDGYIYEQSQVFEQSTPRV